MRLVILISLLFSIQTFAAEPEKEEQSIAEMWRPAMTSIFGESIVKKLIGRPPEAKPVAEKVIMPKIPVVTIDPKSAAVFDKKVDKIVLAKGEEEKYNFSFLTELYEVTRQSKPSEDEFNKMMNTLNQGANREGVYHALVLDPAYSQLEAINKEIRPIAAHFAVYIFVTYFNKNVTFESFKTMNLYTVKRLVAEKALEVIDAFGDNRDGLEKWYAVFSSDMATRFPQHWESSMRKIVAADVHKKWAMKAPIQHIKSETVIKLHIAFNSFM